MAWQDTAAALLTAIQAHNAPDSQGTIIYSQLTCFGAMHDARAAFIAAQPAPGGGYAGWVAEYQSDFLECARIVRYTGGSPPSFDVTSGTLATMSAAMVTAESTLLGSPNSADIYADCLTAAASLNATFATKPATTAQAATYSLDDSNLNAIIARANAYVAFLKFT